MPAAIPKLATLAGWLLAATATAVAQSPGKSVIRNVQLVTMHEAAVLTDHAVIIEDGVIASLVPDASVDPGDFAEVIDGKGGYLTPGLIDAHIHHHRQVEYVNYIAHGVTTVLGLGQGDSLDDFLRVKAAIDAGELAGPAIYTTGGSIANHVQFDKPDDARRFVRELAREGRPYVKVYNNISQPVFDAVVDEAEHFGLAVFGHIPRNFPTAYSLANGLDVVAHAEEFYFAYFGGPRDHQLDTFDGSQTPNLDMAKSVIDLMTENDVALIPNLVFSFAQMRFWEDEDAVMGDPETAYLHPELRDNWRQTNSTQRADVCKRMLRERIKYNLMHEFTRRAHDAGVLLVTGTDAPLPGVFPGKSLHAEMRELIKSGLTYEESLATATRYGGDLVASYVDATARIGRIAPGYDADLVLVAENPLDDIRRMSAIEGVMIDGEWYPKVRLQQMRDEITSRYR